MSELDELNAYVHALQAENTRLRKALETQMCFNVTALQIMEELVFKIICKTCTNVDAETCAGNPDCKTLMHVDAIKSFLLSDVMMQALGGDK
jgi:hypothetical protein